MIITFAETAKGEKMDDLISRKQAIDALEKWLHGLFGITEADGTATIFKTIRQLPPIQPEIVRCKDCKHRDPEDKKCDCGHDIVWNLPRQDDWFCADAERRTK